LAPTSTFLREVRRPELEVEMLRSTTLRVGLATLALALAVSPVVAGNSSKFKSPLKGEEETPPVATNAAGVATYTISEDETSITYRLIVANIDGVTQAHIHCGAPDVAGPVVVFLFGFNAAGVTENGILAEATVTAANLIPRASSAQCPGGIATFAELIAKIRSGEAYTNVHTLAFPLGEIRGQIR
jgi:CHRD domain